jgi:hypothetical protein
VKVEHMHPAGLLQPLQVPEWKWETIIMDFITNFPKTIKKHDAIMVLVDKLSKTSHFIPIKSTFKAIDVANIFMKEIFRLHGFPKTIILDRDAKFTLSFWKSLFVGLQNTIGVQHGLPSSNRWLDRKSEHSTRGHVKDACYASSQVVGRVSTPNRVFL